MAVAYWLCAAHGADKSLEWWLSAILPATLIQTTATTKLFPVFAMDAYGGTQDPESWSDCAVKPLCLFTSLCRPPENG